MEKIIIDGRNGGQRLDKFLKRYMPCAGCGFLYKMLREKKIKLNGKKAQGDARLCEGDEITIFFADETLGKFKGGLRGGIADVSGLLKREDEGFVFAERVIYEDEDVLIFDKPAGLLSQKADRADISVCEYLMGYMFEKGELTEEDLRLYRPSVVNRLDRNTSGALVCAKTLAAARQLFELFKERTVKKEYLALVYGTVTEKSQVGAFWKKDGQTNRVFVSDTYEEGSERIETVYEPLKSCGGATLLSVLLVSGKTHQIRAQLCASGFPILGDPKYFTPGSRRFNEERTRPVKRQFLHSGRISFPKCGGALSHLSEKTFDAPLPKELESYLGEIGIAYP